MSAMQQTQFANQTGGRIFGFPLKGFGLFSSLLLSFASSILTFCVTTMVAIFTMLGMRMAGRAGLDFAVSYRVIGFPAAIIVLAIALPFFLTLWIRAKFVK
jgi:hypothetical protein